MEDAQPRRKGSNSTTFEVRKCGADELVRRVPIVYRAGDSMFFVLGCSPLGSFRWSLGLCYGPYVHSSGWDLNLFLGLFYLR